MMVPRALPSAVVVLLALTACGNSDTPESEGPEGSLGAPSGSPATSDPPPPPAAREADAPSPPSEPVEAAASGDPDLDEGEEPDPEPDPAGDEGARNGGDSEPAWEDVEPPSFTRPDSIRGIYLTAWSAGSRNRSSELMELARETELNTFVIDLKDASGYVSHRTDVEMAREVGADGELRIGDLPGLLQRLDEAGVYPIARIVIFKDHLLAERRPDLALRSEDQGEDEFWRDNGGHPWTSPRSREVWDYHLDLAREAAKLGFPEIQWDYVRFPDIPPSVRETLHVPGSEEGSRAEVIRRFLAYTREELAELDAKVTADVFGVAATAATDVGIGQRWEDFIDVVDAALPMIYPSHYWQGSFGYDHPNAHPYEVVWESLGRARDRSAAVEGAGEVIPWLQDFTMGSPRYGAPEVRAQIQATHDRGIPHWLLWNPGSRYTRDALAPAEGFATDHDPLIRLGGHIIPASQRLTTLLGPAGALPDPLMGSTAEYGWVPPWVGPESRLARPLPPPWSVPAEPVR